jgi:hypothetical protein
MYAYALRVGLILMSLLMFLFNTCVLIPNTENEMLRVVFAFLGNLQKIAWWLYGIGGFFVILFLNIKRERRQRWLTMECIAFVLAVLIAGLWYFLDADKKWLYTRFVQIIAAVMLVLTYFVCFCTFFLQALHLWRHKESQRFGITAVFE